MHLVTLDLEGVLIPEIWVGLAEVTGLPGLRRTTRDEPDYDKLMRYRLDILDQEGLTLGDIEAVVASLKPLPGALEFVQWVQSVSRLIILSDTFEEFARPLMHQLGDPTLFCHHLELGENRRIADYHLRLRDHKRKAVTSFQLLGFQVLAAGDSFNDLTMLRAADHSSLYCPTEAFAASQPDLPVARNHEELRHFFESHMR
ncbi:MAG: bifunctional phosphoserine phosphatase/homoserine phosphotransferase ThrH [Puniceicoccaceae bacterium]